MSKTKIIIIGGGFGGLYTARHLDDIFDNDEVEITLINRTNYFLFTPLLHEVATGGLTPDSIVEPIREVLRGGSVSFVEDTVIDIDRSSKKVKTTSSMFNYDYLVIATGSETNYFNTPGAVEHSFNLKNLSDAVALRNHLIETCERAVQTRNKDLLVTSVIGAGPTGVELAAEIQEYMQHTLCIYYKNSGFKKDDIKVNLITATSDLISQFPQKMRDEAAKEISKRGIGIISNSIVTKVEPNLLTFKSGNTLKTHTIIWVAGVTAGKEGRLEINKYLQTNNTEVFALGDSAGKDPMLAQVAVQQAKIVAKNIRALVKGENMVEFIFTQRGLLISIGQLFAIGNFFGFTFKGKIMWWIWRTIYLFNFHSWRKRFEIMHEWTTNLFYPRDITYLK